MRPGLSVGVSWLPTPAFRAAVEPVLASVEVMEWTLDLGFAAELPPSTQAVLEAFGEAGRLYAHGTGYSPLSAGREDLRDQWLALAGEQLSRFRFARLSEHFGWSTGGTLIDATPLPCPRTPAAVAVGRDRMARLAEIAQRPVGLENLALAFSAGDALRQGAFATELLDAVDGYVHLDLHNLWCQIANFALEPDTLLETWPLERVAVVHVSGGSWANGVRRDTHDARVPDEVWQLLRRALPRMPACEAIFLEQVDHFGNLPDDFARLCAIRDEVCLAA